MLRILGKQHLKFNNNLLQLIVLTFMHSTESHFQVVMFDLSNSQLLCWHTFFLQIMQILVVKS